MRVERDISKRDALLSITYVKVSQALACNYAPAHLLKLIDHDLSGLVGNYKNIWPQNVGPINIKSFHD